MVKLDEMNFEFELPRSAIPSVDVKLKSSSPRLIAQLGHSSVIISAAFSPNGRSILTGSVDKTALLWDAATGAELRRFSGHTGYVNSVAFSPDGKLVLTGSSDFTARMWDATTGEELRRFEGHKEAVRSVVFSPTGDTVLTVSGGKHNGEDKTIRLWDTMTGKELRRFDGHSNWVATAAISPDGRSVLIGTDKTARLWNAATGEEIRRFEGHDDTVRMVAFSPDGQTVLTGSGDTTARLWETGTGKELRRFDGCRISGNTLAFSPNGRYVLADCHDDLLRMWDIRTGKELRRLISEQLSCLAFSPDGRSFLSATYDNYARLWDVATMKELRRFKGNSNRIDSVAFSSNGQSMLTGSEGEDKRLRGMTRLWDAVTGKEQHRFKAHSTAVDFSPDGTLVISAGKDESRIWDSATGRQVHCFKVSAQKDIVYARFSPDGKSVLTGSHDNGARLWDAKNGNELLCVAAASSVTSVAVSPDGRSVLVASGSILLWDVLTREEKRRFDWHSKFDVLTREEKRRFDLNVNLGDGKDILFSDDNLPSFEQAQVLLESLAHEYIRDLKAENYCCDHKVTFSPDGQSVLSGTFDGLARLYDIATGEMVLRFQSHAGPIESVAFSSDGRSVLTGSRDNTARIWDATDGKERHRLAGHVDRVTSVAFSPDSRWVLTGSWDHTARLWNSTNGKEVCQLVSFNDGTWAVTDPDGRYDASNAGDVEGLHWVVGNEPIALDQLKNRYYEPGLLAKVLGFNKEPLHAVSAFTDPKLFPEIALTEPTFQNPVLGINLKNRGGGIGRVVVKINGKELSADARRPGVDPNAASLALEVDLRNDPRLKPGEPNEIEVQAFEAENYLRSRGVKLLYEPTGEKDTTPPELWAIVAGVSDYRGAAIDLRYAAKDAEDFATGLSIAAQRLFGVSKVHLTTLSTERKSPASQPNRTQLVAALEVARHAKPGDILVIYLAGHGVNYGGQDGDFYFLTSDASTAELTDPEVRRQTTLSSQELTDYVKQIPALKQVLILDTCASGRLVEKLTEKRDVPSSQIRALERVKDSTGLHVLAGCSSDSVSYEATSYGQGLLTHSLLLGMRGAALRDDEYVDIGKLFSFAADQVPQLAKDVGGIQRPVIAAPKGTSFDVGRVADDDKAKIPLQLVRPMILRSNFQDEDEIDDILGLGKKVDDALREVSVRGVQSPLVFVDAKEFPEAYRLAGRYRVEGAKVHVDGRLTRGQEKPIRFSVAGEKTELPEIATKIADAAANALAQSP